MRWYWRGQLYCVSKPQHTLSVTVFFTLFPLGVSGWAAHSLYSSIKYSYTCYSKEWMACKPVTYNQEKEDSKLSLSSLAQELIWCALNSPWRNLQRKVTAKADGKPNAKHHSSEARLHSGVTWGFWSYCEVQFRGEHDLHPSTARYRALRSVLTTVILKLKTFSITHYMQVIISKTELRYK